MYKRQVVVTVNDKRFAKLPPEIQTIIKEVALEYERVAAKDLDNRQVRGLEQLKKSGATVRVIPEKVRQEWAQSLFAFPNDMAQEANGRNMPGTQILNSYLAEINQSDYKWPVEYEIFE